ncbi:MAG: porphobilinogen synthase [Desulfurococcales archaeon]|nr:porphobilinogen synthase [Desulfurococcales archaeon]
MRVRPRRLRAGKAVRRLVSEAILDPGHLILPIFIGEGLKGREPIASLPGHYRYGPASTELIEYISNAMELGVKSFLLFSSTRLKDRMGTPAYNREGPIQEAVRGIRRELGWEPLVFTDLCICSYTEHGHCGVPREVNGRVVIDNDETLRVYSRIAVSHAEAGADFIAPSGMMDGQVAAIREALDREGYTGVGIMAYSAKYASAFYGPFRGALDSAPRFGDRRTYQMDPRRGMEALREVELDLEEGADIVMVKPALAYLDVIRLVKDKFPWATLAAYNVSGEYVMVRLMSEAGQADYRVLMMEVLHSIIRAGADIIITYHALEAANLVRDGFEPF